MVRNLGGGEHRFSDIEKSIAGKYRVEYSILEIMPRNRKPGRPKAGREQFCIRMSPFAHATLTKAAGEKGLALGQWLEQMALIRRQYSTEEDEVSNFPLLKRRFEIALDEANELANQLLDLFDENVSVADDTKVKSSLQSLKKVQAKFFDFVIREQLL